MCDQEHPPAVCQKSKRMVTVLWCDPCLITVIHNKLVFIKFCLQCNHENTNALFVLVAYQSNYTYKFLHNLITVVILLL